MSDFVIHLHPELIYLVSALIGGFIIFFGLVSLFIKEKLFLSDALVALLFGIIVGPKVLNLFDPLSLNDHSSITLELSKFAIAIQVMAAGVSMPKAYVWNEFRSLLMLLGPTMLAMWLISGAILYALLPINYVQALLIAASVTPTDPVLANSVVKGRFAEQHIPINVRDILSAESGANDGLGLPYMYLALYLLQFDSLSTVISKWIVLVWIYQILLAIVIGIVAGFIFRKLIYLAEKYDLIDKESFLAFWIALALFLVGVLGLLGTDDILACFVAGNAFAWDNWFSNETREAHLQEVVDMIFNYAYFIFLGASIPWDDYTSPIEGLNYGNLVVIGLLIILLRRLPAMLVFGKFTPAIRNWRQAIFAGWFGPIGVGAIFLSVLTNNLIDEFIKDPTSDPSKIEKLEQVRPYVYPIVTFLVLTSVIVHGITIPLFYIGKHVSTRSRSLTASSAMNVVSRLPIIKPGQDIILVPPSDQNTVIEGTNRTRENGDSVRSSNSYEVQESSFPVVTLDFSGDNEGDEISEHKDIESGSNRSNIEVIHVDPGTKVGVVDDRGSVHSIHSTQSHYSRERQHNHHNHHNHDGIHNHHTGHTHTSHPDHPDSNDNNVWSSKLS